MGCMLFLEAVVVREYCCMAVGGRCIFLSWGEFFSFFLRPRTGLAQSAYLIFSFFRPPLFFFFFFRPPLFLHLLYKHI